MGGENLEAADSAIETLEPDRPEIPQFEHLAEELARSGGDHNSPGGGNFLQPRSQVRRFADHSLLARRALADEIAHDHEARRDPNPRCKRLPGWCAEPLDRLNDRQARLYGALGIILACTWPTEIGQHPVTHQLGKLPADACDLTCNSVLICVQDSRMSSGSRWDESAVDPTRSTNMTVSCRRSA